jgi:hypothetical protein
MRWSHNPVAPAPTPASAPTDRSEAMDVEEGQALPASSGTVIVEMEDEREGREGRRYEEEEETERSWNR